MRLEADFTNYIQNRLAAVEIFSETQSTRNVELDAALKTASKNQTGKAGYPDHIALVEDFVLVMEDKSDRLKLVLRDGGEISQSVDATTHYAINGALFYALKILDATRYKKIFAFGNVGDSKHHILKPIFIDGDKNITELPEVDTFKNFTAENIESYYRRMVLGEESEAEIELKKILRQAETLHEHLRNYGALGETEKPRVVSAILLALAERKHGFNINQLTGDSVENDGMKIFSRVEAHLKRANVRPEVKRDQVLEQFSLIKTSPALNAVHKNLGKTPLKFFTEFIEKNIFDAVVNNSAEDYLGRFYGEFISYSGGDGQTLGVVLTPRHIAELFCELVDLKQDDIVFDPCCGTAGFLIAAMNHMLKDADDFRKKSIKQNQLYGIELRPDMFSTATTNMILRGDGKSNLTCEDFFAKKADELQLRGLTVGFMNPPYSQAKNSATAHLSELRFVLHLLESITQGGRVAVIVPVSAMIGKTRDDKIIKGDILRNHTLEGVISLNKNTFYRIGTVPCIAVFTAGEPHPKNKIVKFINFEDDGFEVKKHVGLVETERAKDKKFYLLDCWRGKIKDAPSKFMVETTIEPADEWLHSFYYYNDELPTDNEIDNSVADYLTFEFNMIAHGREYLFPRKKKLPPLTEPTPLTSKRWKEFFIEDVFEIKAGKRLTKAEMIAGDTPFIGASDSNNGVTAFIGNENDSADENVLGVNYNGSVAENFYHPYRSIFSDDVKRFRLKNFDGNEFVYLFLKASILQQKSKYNYGYKFNETRMRRQKILLPVNDAGAPDYAYMENYVRFVEEKILQRYRDFVQAVDAAQVQPLNEKNWRAFVIGELFKLETGKSKGLNHLEEEAGGISYLGATNRNNGVLTFVKPDENFIQRGNCIAFIRNGEGSIGYSVYKREDFIATSDITCGYANFLNEFVGLFITTVADKVRGKYNFNYKRSDTRLKSERLMLPVNEAGAPDFEYMEAYVKNLMAKKYRKYLEYLDGENF
ncbi:MAG: N-6 DNA methylase [Selenomonadaceae bacterium]|nr:N-6 DNA methylase [Selenomonadaceae bacterium]